MQFMPWDVKTSIKMLSLWHQPNLATLNTTKNANIVAPTQFGYIKHHKNAILVTPTQFDYIKHNKNAILVTPTELGYIEHHKNVILVTPTQFGYIKNHQNPILVTPNMVTYITQHEWRHDPCEFFTSFTIVQYQYDMMQDMIFLRKTWC